jgi:hypothetical protein
MGESLISVSGGLSDALGELGEYSGQGLGVYQSLISEEIA